MVTENEINIIKGPPDLGDIPKISVGKILLERLRIAPKTKAALINSVTDHEISYGELLKESINVAIYLKKIGLKKGDVISIICENSTIFPIPFLAALYIGVTINCLNHTYTTGELQRLLLHSKPKVIFYSKNVKDSLDPLLESLSFVQEAFDVDEINFLKNMLPEGKHENIEEFEAEDFNPNEEIALILTSSGTTGLPKSVMIPYDCLRIIFLFTTDTNYGHNNSEDVASIIVPLSHLFGIIITISVFYNNSTGIISDKFKPENYLNSIQKYKISVMYAVPTLLNFLAKSPMVENFNLDSVRDVICAGAVLTQNILFIVKERLKTAKIRQLYGLTEQGSASIMQTWNIQKINSVGRLMHDFEAIIWDREKNVSLGANQIGELLIRGSTSMKGYVENKQATNEAFDSNGFYKTGDAAYYDDEENFYIVDRYKELIKYKGFQVAPAELEEIILRNPKVKECAVVPKPDERFGEVPVAFVVKQNSNLTEKEIVEKIAENLSINKRLYGGVLFVDDLPKNSFGKIQRNLLKEQAANSTNIN